MGLFSKVVGKALSRGQVKSKKKLLIKGITTFIASKAAKKIVKKIMK